MDEILMLATDIMKYRDAYWKVLNWKPDWDDVKQEKYIIQYNIESHLRFYPLIVLERHSHLQQDNPIFLDNS